MKQTFLNSVAVAIGISAMTILPVSAQVSGWHRLGEVQPESKKEFVRPQKSPETKFLERRGVTNPNARIQPVIEGEFALPTIKQSPARIIKKSVENPRGHFYGVVPRHGAMETREQAFLASIDPVSLTCYPLYYGGQYVGALGEYDYMLVGSAVRNGKLYAYENYYDVPDFNSVWHVIDLQTGNEEQTINFGSSSLANAYSMTWDPEADLFYILRVNNDDSNSHLVVVDPRDWSLKYIKDLGANHYCPSIVYNPMDKQTYVFDLENRVYTIDPKTAVLTQAGELDADYSLFVDYANGAMCYSPMDQQFILLYRDVNQGTHSLLMIDPETWEVADLGVLGGRSDVYISSIVCNDEFAEADAPELPQEMTFNFVKNATSGSIEFTVPSLTYYGVEIPASTPVKTVITDNGAEIYSASLKPGEKVTKNFTLTEDVHNLSLVCSINNKVSPARKQVLCVGNDNPMAPADLYLNNMVLTWSAPGEVGEHNGYVDTSKLTYDIYVDDVRQNQTPVTECSYRLTAAGQDTQRVDIKVVANANNKSSNPGVLNTVFGNGYTIPFSMMPTKEQSELFTVENTNDDYFFWHYTTLADDASKGGMIISMSTVIDHNDWLFLPLLNFTNADVMYQLSFNIASAKNYDSIQSFDIALASRPSSGDIKRVVYSVDEYAITPEQKTFTINFCPPSAGTYFIGIHDRGLKANEAKGMFLTNFKVIALDGTSSAVPENPSNVNITPYQDGTNGATLAITLPTKDLLGNALPSGQNITATVKCGNFENSATGTPGSTVNVAVDAPTLGFQNFDVTLSNAHGAGMLSTYRAYVGIDVPLPPVNIRRTVASDNMSMQLVWDAPGNVGEHGGFVDVNNLLYEIYVRAGIQYAKVGSTNKTNIKFETSESKQSSFVTGPAARNEAGLSSYSVFVQEVLGKPYEMPIVEEFNTTNFNYTPYSKFTQNEFSNSEWENIGAPAGLGLTNCNPVQGTLVGYGNAAGPGKVRFPKISTEGYEEINFKLRYWSYLLSPAIEVYVRTFDKQEEFLLEKFNTRSVGGQWIEKVIKLPAELCNQPWVEFSIRASFTGAPNEYLVIDSWEVSADCDYDLKMMEIEGPTQVSIGNVPEYTITVSNAGHIRNSGEITTELLQTNGTVVATEKSVIPNINPSQTFSTKVKFDIGGEFLGRNNYQIRATVKSNNDELPFNNVRTLIVDVKDCQLPVVNLLRGQLNQTGDQATITWMNPSTSYGNFQDFEIEEPYKLTDKIGAWQNIDFDKGVPTRLGASEGGVELTWEDSNLPCAWTVVNPHDWGFDLEDRLKPHSGNQYIMARSIVSPDEANPNMAADWLISPEVKGGTEISFMYTTLASDYTEYVYLYYSSTGTELDPVNATHLVNGDFIRLRSFSKVGSEGWEKCTYQLPSDAKYFALVYSSYDCLAAMIDDISFTPLNDQKWDIDHFELHRVIDGNDEIIVENTLDRRIVDPNFPLDKSVNYYVLTYVNHEGRIIPGPKSNIVTLLGPDYDGVNSITALDGIYAGKGYINLQGYAGKTLKVFSTDGRLVMTVNPRNDNARFSIDRGMYIITEGRGTAKVIVK